ncbi:MAG: DUF1028 domain-containing protein [Alphaproteobacteria bacterium]|jgi:uncharacterized Ntn-hydrolase superfamily protein|nr:DUF1028 domain-containing protein [Alphaproteobacteria bacterium]MDP7221947.1 DUF1028 domain-containing protein [Alphaproteobacteria bacterium]
MTFSIVAFDPDLNMIGSAVASKWTAVGGCVSYFRPGVGIVHIQNHAYAQVAFRILDHLEQNPLMDLSQSVDVALQMDRAKEKRQIAIATIDQRLYVHTGAECTELYHQKIGKNCAVAGNTLVDKDVIDAMTDAFETSTDFPFTERLIRALEAGQDRGGDARGEEAAAVKAYRFSYPIQRSYPLDLRVDNHEKPLEELRRLYTIFGDNERRFIDE